MEINYNNGKPIDIYSIPEEDREKAAKDFSEGSPSLENCLRILWENSLYTLACCRGDHLEFKKTAFGSVDIDINWIGYIAFAPGVDAFKYLSSEVINNKYVMLEQSDDIQTIRFFCNENTPSLLDKIGQDVMSGEKDNKQELANKVVPSIHYYPEELTEESQYYVLRKYGLDDEKIQEFKLWEDKFYETFKEIKGKEEGTSEYNEKVTELAIAKRKIDRILTPYARINDNTSYGEEDQKRKIE